MTVWYAIPSANPERARKTLARWREMGYRTAVLLDRGTDAIDADLVLWAEPWPGYYQSVIRLSREICNRADIVVTGGDDMLPDPRRRADEIEREFLTRFPDGFGVMQPIGDDLPRTDEICGSPWMGREWVRRAYQGKGTHWGGYLGFYGDEELLYVARELGVLWQRQDLAQFHDHWSRTGGPGKKEYQTRNEVMYWERDKELFYRRKAAGWPGHEPLLPFKSDGIVAVTGAGGFIGDHLVRRLKTEGCRVRAIDRVRPAFGEAVADEYLIRDLRDRKVAEASLGGTSLVFALAANMGGIGFIETHKGEIVRDNTLIDLNTLEAARLAGVRRLLYTSSACVYPAALQSSEEAPPLREEEAYPADPEDGYGWEKLFAERLCRHYHEDFGLDTCVVRLHNVYGPRGAFQGGREKSPAAIARKVALTPEGGELEIWGDGRQVRSYCYIDDCVEGLIRVMASGQPGPMNLGTEERITVDGLADLVCRLAGKNLARRYDPSKPQGVRGRNCDTSLLRRLLRWAPSSPLEDGITSTYAWIVEQIGRQGALPTPAGNRRTGVVTG